MAPINHRSLLSLSGVRVTVLLAILELIPLSAYAGSIENCKTALSAFFESPRETPYFTLETNSRHELYLRHSTGHIAVGKIFTLPKGTKLFHWGSNEEVKRLAGTGKISESEFDFRIEKEGGNQGGGFYASLDPLDSSSYGEKLLVLELQSDSHVIQTKYLHAIKPMFSSYPDLQRALRKAGIDGTYYLSETGGDLSRYEVDRWLNIFNHRAAAKLREGSIDDLIGPDGPTWRKDQKAGGLYPNLLYVNTKYPLKDNAFIKNSAPILSKLISGQELTAHERKLFAPALGYAQATDPTPLAKRLRIEFHREYVEKMKTEISEWLTIDESGRIPSIHRMAFEQRLRYAIGLGIKLDELFSPAIAESLRKQFPELVRKL